MKQIRIALLFDQRIIREKYFSQDTISIGAKGADFFVEALSENVFKILTKGVISIPAGKVASRSHAGSIEIAKKFDSETTFDFEQDDWLILNLGHKLDLVVCYDSPMAGGVSSPINTLAGRLTTPLAVGIVVSFLLHSFVIFCAFWFGKSEEEVFDITRMDPRWIEMMASIEEHREKEEFEEPEPIAEDVDDVIADVSQNDILKPKVDDTPFAGLDKVDKPVGVQAALGGIGLNNMNSLFGSSEGLGEAMLEASESEDGTLMGVGTGFGMGLSGVGFGGGGGGGGGGFGGGIGGIGGGGGGGGKGGRVSGPKKSTTKPKLKLETDAVKEGQFCKESNIREVVQKRASALRNCYEQQLLADPSLSGKIIVFWKIGLDGKVTEASIKSSTMKNERVEACLTKTVRQRLQFDKPDGGICVVEFPFIFTSD